MATEIDARPATARRAGSARPAGSTRRATPRRATAPVTTSDRQGDGPAIEVDPTSGAALALVRPLPVPPAGPKRPDLQLVHSAAQRRRRRLTGLGAVVACVSLFGILVFVAASQAMMVAGQAHLDKLRQRITIAQVNYEKMREVVARNESPEMVAARAASLGLVTPGTVQYLTPTGGAAADVAAAAAAAGVRDEPAPESGKRWTQIKSSVSGAP